LYTEFAEKYPSSKFLKEAQAIKKDSERGIAAVKKLLATEQPKKEKNNEEKQEEIKNDTNEQS
jgi:outer membrane protein assembly factor BamD